MLDTQYWQIVLLLQVLTVKIHQSAYLNSLPSKKLSMTTHLDFHTSNDSSLSQKNWKKGPYDIKGCREVSANLTEDISILAGEADRSMHETVWKSPLIPDFPALANWRNSLWNTGNPYTLTGREDVSGNKSTRSRMTITVCLVLLAFPPYQQNTCTLNLKAMLRRPFLSSHS